MLNKLTHVMFAVTLALGGASAVSAQTVEKSGSTFHVKVCADVPAGQARCHAHVVTDPAGNILENRGRDGSRITDGATPNTLPTGFSPTDLRSAYNNSGMGSSTTIIAIVDAYGYTNAESDLAVYRQTYGLPPCTSASGCFTKYNQNGVVGSYPRDNTGWAQETALDLDMASAMCPDCRIILVEASSASNADLTTAVNTAASLGAHVISNSYGGSETGTTSYEPAYNHPGIAITASSGDSGYGVQFPASSPHVTAVGGTSLSRSGTTRGWSETAWSGAGSGCSALYAKPSWQKDPLCAMRMEADVSAIADPNTGVAVYGPAKGGKSSWQVYGGTSVAAPLIGGIYAANGGSVTYGSNPYANTGALNDVTSGSNGMCGGTYFCMSGPGYDGPTGLGTPNGLTAF